VAAQVATFATTSHARAAEPGLAAGVPLAPLHAQGTQWVRADGSAVPLKGVNLGNWLMPEFWMMGQGSHGLDDQCRLEAVLDKRFGHLPYQPHTGVMHWMSSPAPPLPFVAFA
jgi:endoglucanase